MWGMGSCRFPGSSAVSGAPGTRGPMEGTVTRREQLVFLLLVALQAAHSVEELVGELYEVFAPARLLSSLASDDLRTGFLVVNGVFVLFGLWCFWGPVRRGWASARGLVWLWVVVEAGNGVGHSLLALSRGGYFPGLATAPALFGVAVWLAILLMGTDRAESPRGAATLSLLPPLALALAAFALLACAQERSLVVTATAYNSVPSQTSGDPTIAAWGDKLRPGMQAVAVSRDLLALGLTRGTEVEIEGLPGTFVVLDKTSRRLERTIDIYMGEDVAKAREWGRKEVRITWVDS